MTIDDIKQIIYLNKDRWLLGTHQGNHGNQGNTLEGLFGIAENNLRLPDFGEIELKTQKIESGSYVTLFHREPKPRGSIPRLLKAMGWRHQLAGYKYPADELSFRSTTPANRFTNRGFKVRLDDSRIELVFDANSVNRNAIDVTGVYESLGDWIDDCNNRTPHYNMIFPLYWDRRDFDSACMEKLNNTLMCFCETRRESGVEFYKIKTAYILKEFLSDKLAILFQNGSLVIDFDARTRHNHGTKLRIKRDSLPALFAHSELIL